MRLSERPLLGRRAIDLVAAFGGADRNAAPARRLLVTTMGGLGDGVLLSSIIQHLRRNDAALEVETFARYGAGAALELLPDVPVYRGESAEGQLSALATARRLRRHHYDAALASDQVALTIAATLCVARIPRRLGFAPLGDSRQARLYTGVVRLNQHDSQWAALVSLAQLLQPRLPGSIEPLPLPIPPAAARAVEHWRRREIGDAAAVAAFHLGAGAEYRRWPLDAFITLGKRLREMTPGLTIILTGAAAEHELRAAFMHSYGGRAVDFGGRVLGETAALLERCGLLVANDCGMMHLGAAMGAPTVGLFGPNSPVRWAPRGGHARAVYAGASCSPCIDNFRGPAPRTCVNPLPQECLRAITVAAVLDAIREIANPWRA